MKHPRKLAIVVLLSLIAISGATLPCAAKATAPQAHQSAAPMQIVAWPLHNSATHLELSRANQRHHRGAVALLQTQLRLPLLALRDRIVRLLTNPNLAVLVLAAGVLLIFTECNLPGAIIPGASGLLLVLSGIYGLSLQPINLAALLVLLAAVALLAFAARTPSPLVSSIAGSIGLIYGLSRLIAATNAIPDQHTSVHLPIAVIVGLVIGSSAFTLGRIAERARKNKTVMSRGAETLTPRNRA